jgi:hypothetical protein
MKRITAIAIVAAAFLGCSYVGASTAAISASVAMAAEVKPASLLNEKIEVAVENVKLLTDIDCSTEAQWAMSMQEIGSATLTGFRNSCESGITAALDKTIRRGDFINSLDIMIKFSGAKDTRDLDALISYAVVSQMSFDKTRGELRN